MANKENLVDISSNTQVRKLYKKRGRAKRIVCVVLSVILLLCGSGMVYYYSVLNSLNFESIDDPDDGDISATASTLPEGDSHLTLNDGELIQDSKVLNIMLFGADHRSQDYNGLSDTMIMLSIDNNHNKLKLTSFQRDTYVYIPGHDYAKLNAAYSYGGAKLAINTIQSNFGIKIDRYAVVDFESFAKIIDILGGVDIELTDDEIEYINYQMYKNKQTTDRYTIKDSAGVVHLTGQQALWYARNRGLDKNEDNNEIGLDGDDWDRTQRQRKLLDTIFTSLKDASLTEIVAIVSEVGPLVTTNLKKNEITALVSHSLTYLSYDMEEFNIPSQGMWYYHGSYIKFNDLEAQRLAFAEFVYEELITGQTSTTAAQ